MLWNHKNKMQTSLVGSKQEFQGFKRLWNFERVFLVTNFFNSSELIASKRLHESSWIFAFSFTITFYKERRTEFPIRFQLFFIYFSRGNGSILLLLFKKVIVEISSLVAILYGNSKKNISFYRQMYAKEIH